MACSYKLSSSARARAHACQHGRALRGRGRPRAGRRTVAVRADANDSIDFSLAPSKPSTPFGKMLAYYLQMEPRLFETAVNDQFEQLKSQRERREAGEASASEAEASASEAEAPSSEGNLTLSGLSSRIQEVQEKERRATVEDLMYMCILEEFMKLGVELLPKMDNYIDVDSVTLKPLMEGVHTREAVELVREHMMTLMGRTALMPPTVTLKMSKLQMAQVYAASVMFGYFLRRVDNRFQLARQSGMLPQTQEDAVERLERLFSMESDESDPDSVGTVHTEPPDLDAVDITTSSGGGDVGGEEETEAMSGEKKPALRKYIETFDQDTMRDTARMMSKEGMSLLDRQSTALWGEAKKLQEEMQKAIGMDVSSMEEVMKRAEKAVAEDEVEVVTMSLATQRRAVLEAVAFGTFLRDIEDRVDSEYGLLTPLPAPKGPGGGPPDALPSA